MKTIIKDIFTQYKSVFELFWEVYSPANIKSAGSELNLFGKIILIPIGLILFGAVWSLICIASLIIIPIITICEWIVSCGFVDWLDRVMNAIFAKKPDKKA